MPSCNPSSTPESASPPSEVVSGFPLLLGRLRPEDTVVSGAQKSFLAAAPAARKKGVDSSDAQPDLF